ncbi:MAG: c-type cytochrome domain-containing protein [Bacteroidota bacterium]
MAENLGAFLGKFHPLVIHFPIVLVSLIALISLFSSFSKPWAKGLLQVLPFLWGFAILSSLGAVLSGFLLYGYGMYEGELVTLHQQAGWILLGSIGLVGGYFFWRKKLSSKGLTLPYKLATVILFLLVIYTSHLGGSLTHGVDFLTFQRSTPEQRVQEAESAYQEGRLEVYAHVLLPLLKAHCMSCHNTYKQKGGLNMENWEAMLSGGKSGKPLLIGGQAELSELMVRISLPKEDDEYMPPDGKKPLPPEALILLKWWIEQGAERHQVAVDSLFPGEVQNAIKSLLPEAIGLQKKQQQSKQKQQRNFNRLLKLAAKLQVSIEPDPQADSQLFALSLSFPPQHFDDEDLKELLPYRLLFSKLSLPGTEISDEGLFHIGQFENLRELYVPKTCLKGEGLAYLSKLPQLQLLNLSGTQVENQHILHLLHIESLKEVFLYQTPVSPNLIQALNDFQPDRHIRMVEGPLF